MKRNFCTLILLALATVTFTAIGANPRPQDTTSPNRYTVRWSQIFAAEHASNAVVEVMCDYGDRGMSGTVAYSVKAGTATPGEDFIPVSGRLYFSGPGGSVQRIRIPLVADQTLEGDETFQVVLSEPAGVIDNSGTATVTIFDSSRGRVSFASAANVVNETASNAVIRVVREGGAAGSVTVDFRTRESWFGTTATEGSDFTPVSGTLTFADGETTKTFEVPVFDDGQTNRERTVQLLLQDSFGGATLGRSEASLAIEDDLPPRLNIAPAPAGGLQLSWSAGCRNYQLEKSSLSGNQWTEVTTAHSVSEGKCMVVEPSSANLQIYRLRKR